MSNLCRTSSVASLALLAAALGAPTIPFGGKEIKDKTCSKCLKPFSNRGAYCPECHKAQKESNK